MDPQKKEIAAAISAVMQYIKSQEEATAQASLAMAETKPPNGPGFLNVWGQNGRQMQMQLRNLMQLRTFGRK